jgi:hypothetical protein
MSTFTRPLKCDLTRSELNAKSDEMAQLVEEAEKAEDAKKDFNAKQKELLDGIGGKIRTLARQIRTRSEERAVECREEPHLERNMISVIRLDTCEIVEDRKMREEERALLLQAELPFNKRARAREKVVVLDDKKLKELRDAAETHPEPEPPTDGGKGV